MIVKLGIKVRTDMSENVEQKRKKTLWIIQGKSSLKLQSDCPNTLILTSAESNHTKLSNQLKLNLLSLDY